MNQSTKQILIFAGCFLLIAGAGTGAYFGLSAIQKAVVGSSVKSSSTLSASQATSSKTGSEGSTSTSETSQYVTDSPTLTGNKSAIEFSIKETDGDFGTESFVVALQGIASDADSTRRSLYISCDDSALDSWLKMTVLKDGVYTKLAAPYTFSSGDTVYVTPLKVPDLTTEYKYKIPLWIKASSYSDIYWLIDVTVYNGAHERVG